MALRILLADDEKEFVDTLAERLSLRGYAPCVVYDGISALQAATPEKPDVVVLDLDLAGESGLELIPALVLKHGVAVIIFTSADDPLTRKRSFSAGAAAFVSKYAPVGELISAIKATRPRLMDMGGLSRPPRSIFPHK